MLLQQYEELPGRQICLFEVQLHNIETRRLDKPEQLTEPTNESFNVKIKKKDVQLQEENHYNFECACVSSLIS